MNKEKYIKSLGLEPHIEGGYYKQILKSDVNFDESHKLYTSIYFLLDENNVSNFHRLKSDEIWYYHDGNPLTVHIIDEQGEYSKIKLGKDIENGEVLQAVVRKNTIFGSDVESGFALVSCMVAPGFEYDDFELFSRKELLDEYPQYQEIIERLTRE